MSLSIFLTTLAGTPKASELSGIYFVTTAPAPTTTLFPIVTPGWTVTLPPNHSSLPICISVAFAKCLRRPFGLNG